MVVLTSFTQPTDGIRHRQNNTTVYVNDNNLGKGTLYIAESRLSWVSDSGNGFSIEYPHISLHAVSRDLSAFPRECLFLMLDTALGDEETSNGGGENEDGNENGSDEETTEIRLVPDDRGMLEAMFHAMNVCQALHPDPEDSFSDEDFFEDADDESPVEEADNRMAGLRIENMGGRLRSCMEGGDMEEEDMVVGREGGTLEEAGMVGDTLGTLGEGDMVEDMVGDISVVEDKAGDISVEDMAGGRAGDISVEDMAGGRAGDISVVDMAGGRAGDISVVDMAGGRLGILEGGMVGDMAEGRVGMVRRDRSFLSGSNRHRGSSAQLPAANPLQMDFEKSHFEDAEN